jgi:glyoxylase-like metal-dependent hydrolase (beta-lactamase superfamily II)
MKLRDDVYLVGGGNMGFNLSGTLDCHVYLLDGGGELALIDTGLGDEASVGQIIANIEADGLDPQRITRLILTHYHADHAGGAAAWAERLGASVHGSPLTAQALSTGDEAMISLDVARRAGFYPADYRLRPCPVVGDLHEGQAVQIGSLTLTPLETPGHCRGHLSFLLDSPLGSRALIGADLVFYGGQILLQNIHDCSISEYAQSVFKVAELDFEAFFPGHFAFSLRDGKRHVEAAASAFRQLGVPKNVF